MSVEERINKLWNRMVANGDLDVAGFKVDEFGVLLNAPCACPGCQETGRQPGHKYCQTVTPELLEAQEDGHISAQLDNAGWYWKVV